ncbi:MAG: phosphatase PAP2 family protein [Flavobacteriales bacterium]|nr:phosphatase PAP2 family protein [Flavobacteriales bacterium]|tara:strand:- start:175 stop:747 length:573 start_codon:yes stop_codon:yes gene_type:complete
MIKSIVDLDRKIFLFLNNLGIEFWDPFWIFISNKWWMFLLIAPIILGSFFREKGSKSFYAIFMLIICFAVTDFIHVHLFKNVFLRLRPCWDPEIAPLSRVLVNKGGLYGFVSGHAANSAAIVAFFLFTTKRTYPLVKYFLIFWVLLVSYSRIYLGKHYLLDVLCGMFLGFLIAFFFFKLYNIFFVEKCET